MSRRRSRSRSRSASGGSWVRRFAVLVSTVAVVAVVFQAGAFDVVNADRNAVIDVSSDATAKVGLDIYTVTAGQQSKLVTVTNNLARQATFEISLVSGPDGKLSLDGQSGSKVTASLLPSESVTVDFVSGGDDSCSTDPVKKTTKSYAVTFVGCSYDAVAHETTYTYKVEGIGEDSGRYHDLSHIVFGVPDSFDRSDVVSTSPKATEFKFATADPTTGVSGIKWGEEAASVDKVDGEQVYEYTLEGRLGTEQVDVGVKTGGKPGGETGGASGDGEDSDDSGDDSDDDDDRGHGNDCDSHDEDNTGQSEGPPGQANNDKNCESDGDGEEGGDDGDDGDGGDGDDGGDGGDGDGATDGTTVVRLPGPSQSVSSPDAGGETITFEVEATNSNSGVELRRTTSVVSGTSGETTDSGSSDGDGSDDGDNGDGGDDGDDSGDGDDDSDDNRGHGNDCDSHDEDNTGQSEGPPGRANNDETCNPEED